ncbi:MAG: CBS domain-containing protein [Alphaproteobacteria bacterium]|nr:CBS domain-containing protein [Alphaproteobacteria bacterium]
MRRNEPVSHIMTKSPATVHHGMALSEVRAKLTEIRAHHMPVVSGKKLVGIISTTDLLRVSYEHGENTKHANAVLDHTRTIEDVMQTDPVTIDSKTTIREAAQILSKNWFHALPVVDDGDLVGIVTTTDLIDYLLEQY